MPFVLAAVSMPLRELRELSGDWLALAPVVPGSKTEQACTNANVLPRAT